MVVYLAGFTDNVLIDSPLIAFAGRMDEPTIDIDGATCKITLNCESRLLDMNIAVDRRYTQEDQQMTWPGDLCFSFVNGVSELTLYWGSAPTTQGNV